MKLYNQNIEPLELFLTKYNFEINGIEKICTGQKYTAVLLKSGNIGVCANFGHKIDSQKANYSNPNLKNISHRIVLNAYFSALFNYSNHNKSCIDIFEAIDFKKYKKVVMLGLFNSLSKKFDDAEISIIVSDPRSKNHNLSPASEQKKFLSKADTVILTSTSVFNATFLNVINHTNDQCDIFMLGPSSIMTPEMFHYKNIKIIFGATFMKFDHRVLKIIQEDGGTKDFLKYENKRILQKVNI
ncbi:MAG: DUF364 domain-containing protein [Bacteroidetes bacterium]|nr:DUF364 domain-containing protein [Bacteroidota bacterium]